MYNDVDMVWLADPFPYLQGQHDVYFTDDMAAVSIQKLILWFIADMCRLFMFDLNITMIVCCFGMSSLSKFKQSFKWILEEPS